MAVCHQTFARPHSIFSDNNEVCSDRLSDQRIRREPKGLSWWTVRVTMNVRSILCMV